jgi:hypothetical protein
LEEREAARGVTTADEHSPCHCATIDRPQLVTSRPQTDETLDDKQHQVTSDVHLFSLLVDPLLDPPFFLLPYWTA